MTTRSVSERMAGVRQRGTKAELATRRAATRAGLHYRLNVRCLPGAPDLANKRRRWAIFVHGCFWHRHPGCRRTTIPKTNTAFWEAKFAANVARDRDAITRLEALGYRVLVVWECETEDEAGLRERLARFRPDAGALPYLTNRST